jgi:molybdopterin biosynthesis enzyme
MTLRYPYEVRDEQPYFDDIPELKFSKDNRNAVVCPFRTQDSSMLTALAKADALVKRPPFASSAPKGAAVEIIRLDITECGF